MGVGDSKRLAVLITGQFRMSYAGDILKLVESFPPETDFFVGTYFDHAAQAKVLVDFANRLHCHRVVHTNASAWMSLVSEQELEEAGVYTNLMQWHHLHRLLVTFGTRLQSDYDYIIKIRSDINFVRNYPLTMSEFSHVEPGNFYARSDFTFYAESTTFINIMGDFYPTAAEHYLDHGDVYFPINFTSIRNSYPETFHTTDEKERKKLLSRATSAQKRVLNHHKLRTGCSTAGLVYPCRFSKYIKNKNVIQALLTNADREDHCQDEYLLALLAEGENATTGRAIDFLPGQREAWLHELRGKIQNKSENKSCGQLKPKNETGGDRKLLGQVFCNLNATTNKRFGSEKNIILHVLARAPLKEFRLPLLGKNAIRLRELPKDSVKRMNISQARMDFLLANENRNLNMFKQAALKCAHSNASST